jgi:hypothetical protein
MKRFWMPHRMAGMRGWPACLALAGLITAAGHAANYGVVQSQHARPTSIQMLLPALNAEDVNYTFEVVLVEIKTKTGQSQIRVAATIIRTGDGKTVRIKDMTQIIAGDATQFTVTADGRDFVFEASYTEASTSNGVPPREIPTTFLQMFAGGPVGIKVRLL